MKFTAGVARNGSTVARRAFTLIEIMVVIVVIAIIAALVAPNVFKNVGEAKITSAKAQMETLAASLDMYRIDNGQYPTTDQGLAALWEAPTIEYARNWKGPYLRKSVPLDPWGQEYVYVSPGELSGGMYDLYSLGNDGQLGGEGEDADVLSWISNSGG